MTALPHKRHFPALLQGLDEVLLRSLTTVVMLNGPDTGLDQLAKRFLAQLRLGYRPRDMVVAQCAAQHIAHVSSAHQPFVRDQVVNVQL